MKANFNGNYFSRISLQIKIGITGHRNIHLTEELKKSIHFALSESVHSIINPDGKSLNTPFSYKILTALADGADRIIAVEAIQTLNSEMEVILPMMKEEYEETFYNDKSKEEFENLLQKAVSIEILINKSLKIQFPDLDLSGSRKLAYQNVGESIVKKCDILIALWDGVINDKKGGTSDVILRARKQGKPIIIISSNSPYEIKIEKGDEFIRRILGKLEDFNKSIISDDEINKYENNFGRNLFEKTDHFLNPDNVSKVKESLIPFYIRASRIAKKYQRLYHNAGLVVYILSPIAVASVALGILFNEVSTFLFLIEFIILLAILMLIFFSDRKKIHKKWIQNRFLAERLRSSIFFVVCGFRPKSIDIFSNQDGLPRSDDWMIRAYNEIRKNVTVIQDYKQEEYSVLLEYIKDRWIRDQKKFHENKSVRSEKKNRLLEISGWMVFVLALITSAVHLIFLYSGLEYNHEWISKITVFATVTLPAVGASYGAIRKHREYSRNAKRSREMAVLLNVLLSESEEVRSMNDLEKYLHKIQDTMLQETQDWLLLMKFVKIDTI